MLKQLMEWVKGDATPNPHNLNLKEYNKTRALEDRKAICNAPFKSMRIEQMGLIRTCCYNHFYLLGRYPQTNLHDIWFGPQVESLRQTMLQYDLGRGCDLCFSQIKNGQFNSAKTKQYDNLGPSANGYPVVLDFSLHNTCNLECVMCQGMLSSSIRKNRDKLPALKNAYANDNFIQELEVFIQHARQFVFAGGEPFLIDTYYQIWDSIAMLNKKVTIDIVTNGTVLSPKVKRVVELLKPNISVSIESLQEDNYMAIRKNGNLQETLSNIDYFYNACKLNGSVFSMSVCPLQLNWHEIPDLLNMCNDMDVKLYIHTVNSPANLALWSLPVDKLQEIISFYKAISMNADTANRQHNANVFADLVKQVEGWYQKAVDKQGAFNLDTDTYIDAVDFLEQIQQKFIEHGYLAEAERIQEIVEAVVGRNLRIPSRAATEITNGSIDALVGLIQSKANDTLVSDLELLNASY